MASSKIPDSGVHHIQLGTDKFDAALKFYTEGLGLKPYAAFGSEFRIAMLALDDGALIELKECPPAEGEQSPRWVHLAIATSDARTAYQVALDAGAVSVMEPRDANLGAACR